MQHITEDLDGREYLKLSEAKADQLVELDDGFDCAEAGKVRLFSGDNGLWFKCRDGKHLISGQADDGIHCIGIYP